MLSRRDLLRGTLGGLAGLALPSLGLAADPARPGSRLDGLVTAIEPELHIHNLNTDETIKVRFHDITGYDLHAVAQLNHIMRDWRQKEVRNMDLRLFWGLSALRQAAMKDGHEGLIRLHSGFRTRKTNEHLRKIGYNPAPDSLHMRAQAADFHLEGVAVDDIARYAAWLEIGGTGYYPGSFVHIDSGIQRSWKG